MKRSKTTKRSLLSLLGGLMLLAFVAPTALTSCQNEQPDVDLTIRMKFDGIVDAIMQMSTTLEEKLALIESAMKDGFADNQAAQELVRSALASLSGSTEEKLAAIEATVTAQTASLEMKLALIEAAVKDGFADGQAQQELLLQAVDALEGSVEEKLAAIEEAVKGQTTCLETKIGLVEAAVKEGLADSATAQDLIRTALESLGGTLEDKMAAVVSAISSQTADLSTKLGLIEAAVKEGFTEAKAQQEMIQTALDSLDGTLEEKLAAIQTAVTSQTVSLEAKLDLIEAALAENVTDDKSAQELIKKAIESLNGSLAAKMATIERAISGQTTDLETKLAAIETALKNGIGDVAEAQGLIQQALTSLTGTETDKLDEIEKAITSQTSSLDTYLKAIETAVEKGFTDTKGKLDLIAKAVNGLGGTADEVLDKLQKAMSGQLSKLDSKLDAIKDAVTKGFVGANEALGLIKAAIDAAQKSVGTSADNLKTALAKLIKAIQDIDKAISDNVAATLTKMLDAIVNQPDYSKLLEEIKDAIDQLIPTISIEISDEYMENDEVMMLTEDSLRIAYTVTSNFDATVTVTPSDDISATVVPDTDDPLKGVIQIESGKSITDGKTKVEITASNKGASVKRTLFIKEAYLKPLEPITQITETIHVTFDCTTLELKLKSNMETSKPEVPDSLRNESVPWLKVLSYDKTDETTTIQVKLQPNMGLSIRETSVTVKETRFHRAALEFRIQQGYDDKIIDFEDKDLFDKIRETVDIDNDFKICNAEAKMVKSLNDLFGNELTEGATYESFDEFQYFTGIETIPAGSFKGWKNLQSITLPESITTIQGGYGDEDGPFVECSSLKKISGKFATDDGQALNYNGILLKVLEEIADYIIPDGVQVVGSKAFYKSMISSVTFPTSLKTIRDHAFEYSMINAVNFSINPGNETTYVDSIAENSFVHCFYLKEFNGPTNGTVRVTPDKLGLYQGTTLLAFAWGSTLKSNESPITAWSIPDSLGIQKLPESVFDAEGASSGSYLLRKLGLPSTLTYICKGAFQYLQNVSDDNNKFSIYFKGGDPPETVEKDAFMNVTQKTVYLYVPAVLNSDYPLNIDANATNKRITNYLVMMGMGYDFFMAYYYTNWPF